MNKQLQTNLTNDYIIVFHDSSHKQISLELGEKLIQLSATSQKTFILDKQLYNFSNIAKLLPILEYYQQYPEKRPQSELSDFTDIYKPVNFSTARRIHAIQSGIRGLKHYIASPDYQGTDKPHKLIRHMEARIKEIEKEEKGTKKSFNPAQFMYGDNN